MKKILTIALIISMILCYASQAFAGDPYLMIASEILDKSPSEWCITDDDKACFCALMGLWAAIDYETNYYGSYGADAGNIVAEAVANGIYAYVEDGVAYAILIGNEKDMIVAYGLDSQILFHLIFDDKFGESQLVKFRNYPVNAIAYATYLHETISSIGY